MMNQLNKYFLFLFLLCTVAAKAQPQFNFDQIRKEFPDKDFYMLNKSQHIVIGQSKGKLTVESSETTDILYLSERSTRAAEKVIPYYSSFSKLSDIEAKTWVPTDGKLKSVKVETIGTRKRSKDGIFYDDSEEKYFLYPSLQQGAVTSLSYVEELFDPHLLGSYFFSTGVPVRSSTFKVTFPESVRLKYKMLGDVDSSITFREEKRKGTITYIFEAKNLKEIEFEENAPDIRYYSPHVVIYIDSYEADGKKVELLPDVNGLFAWYNDMVSKVKNDASVELKSLADSIRKTSVSESERLKAAFYWQQDNIKYIAFEDGLGGFIPRNPADVLRKRYGDCKDKAYLLSLLLRELGFESYPAWIGTRDIPYSYKDVPAPIVDNHMITALRLKNDWMFLDATSHFLSLGTPTAMIQGKEAMIRKDSGSFEIVKVPVMDKEKNVRSDLYKFKLDGKNLVGTGSQSFTGYLQQSVQMGLNYTSPAKREESLLKNLGIASNKYVSKKMSINGFGQRDSVLSYDFDLALNDYAEEIDGKLYVNLSVTRVMPGEKEDLKKRTVDISNDFKYINKCNVELEVPAGYKVESLPQKSGLENDKFGYSAEYSYANNKLILHQEFWVNTLSVTVAEFKEWNAFLEKLMSSYKSIVILQKK